MANTAPIFRGTSHQGKIEWDKGDGVRFRVALGKLEGKRIEVAVRAQRKRRSLNQNSYYHGIVVPMIAEAVGYGSTEEDHEMTHEGLKLKFLKVHDGAALPTVKSTTQLTTVEFEDYMLQCRQFGAELGIYIPSPCETSL